MKNFGLISLLGAILAVSLLLGGCSSTRYPNLPPLPNNISPDSPAADNFEAYRIQIGDVLDLKFYLNPEFDETVTVRPDGMISTKIIQDLQVYNQTVSEVNDQIKELYRQDLKDPRVTTVVRSFAPIKIYVSGEVNAPGEFVVVGQALTLTQAIARAGGIKNSGQGDRIVVIRRGAGEQGQLFVADYDAATQFANPAADARLAPNDVVFVPKTGVALDYVKFQQYFQQFTNFGTNVGYSISN